MSTELEDCGAAAVCVVVPCVDEPVLLVADADVVGADAEPPCGLVVCPVWPDGFVADGMDVP
jgi:hypothetical protein